MTTPMLAADEPRLHACARTVPPVPFSSLPAFESDAERYAWLAAEYKRRIKPGINKAKLARDIGAVAFDITIERLLSSSRAGEGIGRGKGTLAVARQKIISFTCLITGIGPRQLGALFNRDHSTIIYACRKYHDEIAALLRGSV